ncbi:M55 family metallopeptidase [Paremcibacter congregatus]|uniref:M55 family metallopeptidase n=1 Tax=Paremcibacter congregatus TaxID=2043170 RepID=UPI003A9528A7
MKQTTVSLLLSLCLIGGITPAKADTKIYISGDMEGLAGSVTGQQLSPKGFEYNQFREFYTNEVNAAIDAAFEAGATEVLVSDSHGNGQSLLMDKLDKRVKLVRSWPRPKGMMQGIDKSFDGAIFIGYHAGADNPAGALSHTINGGVISSLKLNGVETSEAGISAAVAGHYGVPVIMISGDQAVAEETRALLGDVETAVVKWDHGFTSVTTLLPDAATDLISKKTTAAVKRLKSFKPHKIEGPITVEVGLQNYQMGNILSFLPFIERTGARTLRFEAKDILEVVRFVSFINYVRPNP